MVALANVALAIALGNSTLAYLASENSALANSAVAHLALANVT